MPARDASEPPRGCDTELGRDGDVGQNDPETQVGGPGARWVQGGAPGPVPSSACGRTRVEEAQPRSRGSLPTWTADTPLMLSEHQVGELPLLSRPPRHPAPPANASCEPPGLKAARQGPGAAGLGSGLAERPAKAPSASPRPPRAPQRLDAHTSARAASWSALRLANAHARTAPPRPRASGAAGRGRGGGACTLAWGRLPRAVCPGPAPGGSVQAAPDGAEAREALLGSGAGRCSAGPPAAGSEGRPGGRAVRTRPEKTRGQEVAPARAWPEQVPGHTLRAWALVHTRASHVQIRVIHSRTPAEAETGRLGSRVSLELHTGTQPARLWSLCCTKPLN